SRRYGVPEPPQSLPTRCDSPAASPESRCAPDTQFGHREDSVRGPLCGTFARQDCTGPIGSVLPSNRVGVNSRAQRPYRQCRVLLPLPPVRVAAPDPECKSAYWRAVALRLLLHLGSGSDASLTRRWSPSARKSCRGTV